MKLLWSCGGENVPVNNPATFANAGLHKGRRFYNLTRNLTETHLHKIRVYLTLVFQLGA